MMPLLVWLLIQEPFVAPSPTPPDLPRVESLAQGLRELVLAAGEKRTDEAVAIGEALLAPNALQRWRGELEGEQPWLRRAFTWSEPVLELAGWGGLEEAQRADVRYALGVVHGEAGELGPALEQWHAARALAGPGELRLDAGYNLGAAVLAGAELLRAQAQSGPAPPPGALAATQADDPTRALQSELERAKTLLVERLRADWRDADTRANLELIQRRLREIEEQQKSEQHQPGQNPDQQSGQDGKPQPGEDSAQDEKPQDSPEDQQSQDPQSKSDPSQGDPGSEAEPEERARPEVPDNPAEERDADADAAGAEPDASEAGAQPNPGQANSGQPGREIVLTKEQVQQLLQQLAEIEREGQALKAQITKTRNRGVDKDW